MSVITMTPSNLERTHSQRMQALDRANETRCRRAQFKIDVKAGDESVRGLLAEPPWWAESMKAFDLLLAMPGVGRVKLLKWMRQADTSPSKTLQGLTGRQRTALLLTVWAWERR